MATGEDHSTRTETKAPAAEVQSPSSQQQQEADEDASVVSTTCSTSSADGDDAMMSASQRPAPKKTLWKDKGGRARYVSGNTPPKDDAKSNNKPKDPREVIAAGAVTAAVAAGAIGGAIVLGPVGLAVGGLASAGSAASAFATRRRLEFAKRKQQQEAKAEELRQSSIAFEEMVGLGGLQPMVFDPRASKSAPTTPKTAPTTPTTPTVPEENENEPQQQESEQAPAPPSLTETDSEETAEETTTPVVEKPEEEEAVAEEETTDEGGLDDSEVDVDDFEEVSARRNSIEC